jgi:GxxExxY protein
MLVHEWRLLYRYPMLTNDGQLTEIIIGAAMNVLNKLKPGLDEKIYERALVELAKQGLVCEQQKQHPVHYDELLIGTLIRDLIVNGLLSSSVPLRAFRG